MNYNGGEDNELRLVNSWQRPEFILLYLRCSRSVTIIGQ